MGRWRGWQRKRVKPKRKRRAQPLQRWVTAVAGRALGARGQTCVCAHARGARPRGIALATARGRTTRATSRSASGRLCHHLPPEPQCLELPPRSKELLKLVVAVPATAKWQVIGWSSSHAHPRCPLKPHPFRSNRRAGRQRPGTTALWLKMTPAG